MPTVKGGLTVRGVWASRWCLPTVVCRLVFGGIFKPTSLFQAVYIKSKRPYTNILEFLEPSLILINVCSKLRIIRMRISMEFVLVVVEALSMRRGLKWGFLWTIEGLGVKVLYCMIL